MFSLIVNHDPKNLQTGSIPLAVVESDGKLAPIVALNREAGEFGAALKMTATQARVVCPELLVKVQNHERENAEIARIKKTLQQIGPCVQISPLRPNGALIIFLDSTGLLKLHGSEADLARRLIVAVTALGYPARVGLAKNRFIAKVAAETSPDGGFTAVPTGREKAFVEHIEIAHLDLKTDTRDSLRDLGLSKMEQLAAFPTNEMAERFGAEGTAIISQARGRDESLFVREYPREQLSNEIFLTYRLFRAETIRCHFERLTEQLLEPLLRQGLGCRRIEVALTLDSHRERYLQIELAVKEPTRSCAQFARQLENQLTRTKLTAGVIGLKITIPKTALLPCRQLGLGNNRSRRDSSSGREDSLDGQKLFGITFNHALLPEQSFSLTLLNDPDRSVRTNRLDVIPYAWHPTQGLRLFKVARPVEVTLDHDRPTAVRSRRFGAHPVAALSGPWELSGGWWQQQFDRLYYRLQTRDRRSYLFFFDRLATAWFWQGVFD